MLSVAIIKYSHVYTFMTNSMTNIPKNIASVDTKNMGMEVRSEVVSIAIVIQLRRMVAIIIPLKRGVCITFACKIVSKLIVLLTSTTRHTKW